MEKTEILLLKALFALPEADIGKFIIVEMGDIVSALDEFTPEEVSRIMEKFSLKEYLALKYNDGEEYCFALTQKAKLAVEEAERAELERIRQEQILQEQKRQEELIKQEAARLEEERRKKEEALAKKKAKEAEKRRAAALEAIRLKEEAEARQKAADEKKALEIAETVIDLTARSAKKGKLSVAEKKEIKAATGNTPKKLPEIFKGKKGVLIWTACTFLSGIVSGMAGAAMILAAIGII